MKCKKYRSLFSKYSKGKIIMDFHNFSEGMSIYSMRTIEGLEKLIVIVEQFTIYELIPDDDDLHLNASFKEIVKMKTEYSDIGIDELAAIISL